jgi:hypothetical protein
MSWNRMMPGPYSLYGDSWHADAHSLRLDPIDCAGQICVKRLREAAENGRLLKPLSAALDIITHVSAFEALFIEGADLEKSKRFIVDKKWRPQLTQLEQYKVIKECSKNQVRFNNGYFAVGKSDDDNKCPISARAIFNGKRLSKLQRAPAPVNLPAVADILRQVALNLDGEPVDVFTADIRHFFHQIPVGVSISEYLGFVLHDIAYCWLCLPMGWAWSPHVAQCIAWMAILRNNQENLCHEGDLPQTPQFMRLRDGGIVCIYYDNLFVAGPQCGCAERVFNNFVKNCIHFNIKLKYSRTFRPADFRKNVFPSFLGVELRIRRFNNRFRLTWRQDAARLTLRWIPEMDEEDARLMVGPTELWSRREIARIVGRTIWRHSLTMRPLFDIQDLIDIIVRMYNDEGHIDWDKGDFTLSSDEIVSMTRAQLFIRTNTWHELAEQISASAPVVLCASDASDSGLGGIQFGATGFLQREFADEWTHAARGWHIYVKEVLAAIRTIKWVLAEREIGTGIVIYIGIDNSAAAAALRCYYSRNRVVASALRNLYQLTSQQRIGIVPVGLKSADNAADPASRGRPILATNGHDQHRTLLERCFEVVSSRMDGIIASTYDGRDAPSSDCRHPDSSVVFDDRSEVFDEEGLFDGILDGEKEEECNNLQE